jgi:hypothetical protein
MESKEGFSIWSGPDGGITDGGLTKDGNGSDGEPLAIFGLIRFNWHVICRRASC